MAAQYGSNECNAGLLRMSLVTVSFMESMDFHVMSICSTYHLPYLDVERLIEQTDATNENALVKEM